MEKAMCFRFLFVFLLFITLGEISEGGPRTEGNTVKQFTQRQCGFTRYPDLCMQTLLELRAADHEGRDIMSALVAKIREETMISISSLRHCSSQTDVLLESQHTAALGFCSELLEMSLRRLNQSLSALKLSPRKSKHDIQAWLSAVVTFQQTCKDSIDALSSNPAAHIPGRMEDLSKLASNALSLVNPIVGRPENASYRNFPPWVSSHHRKLLQSSAAKADVVVAQDGSGNYRTISAAVNAASGGGRFVIYVKAGVYREKIQIRKDGITLIGDGKYSTIITGDDGVTDGYNMPDTATVVVSGDDFMARNIGIQNTAGPGGAQALALRISSDRSVLYRCSLAGYQDTLFALALRQFYRECDIHGTIDFIFGNAAAVFQRCNIVLRRPQGGAYNVILANGRTDPGQTTGFSVHDSRIVAGSELAKHSVESYLGRPWKEYSRAVVMQSAIDGAIARSGWKEWDGGFALKTLYFAEYLNEGPGAGTSGRITWPGFHVIGAKQALQFTVGNFIKGSLWLPSTGVSFISGLS